MSLTDSEDRFKQLVNVNTSLYTSEANQLGCSIAALLYGKCLGTYGSMTPADFTLVVGSGVAQEKGKDKVSWRAGVVYIGSSGARTKTSAIWSKLRSSRLEAVANFQEHVERLVRERLKLLMPEIAKSESEGCCLEDCHS